ncbi:glycosyltransferase family A protein [Roseovarius litoreus]|uniref:glycosyltransferase family A protein n=1 Tax=Roseovarius litoreus TaxID=1155722 RepID=UPI00122C827F|nr:glycosyltransferase family A protein [Roseovarius litoreus]
MRNRLPDDRNELTVAIATMGSRLRGIALPDPVERLRYLIVVQPPDGHMLSGQLCGRGDLHVLEVEGLGLSQSRNIALETAETDLVVFADDDMVLRTEGLLALATHLQSRPDLSFVAGWREDRLPKHGRRAGRHMLGLRNSGRICAPELIVRRNRVLGCGVRFDEAFGKGARYGLGEEYVFVADMLRAGMRGEALPVIAGAHRGPSSGDLWDSPALYDARLAVQRRVFGRWAWLVHPLYAMRHARRFGRIGLMLRFALGRRLGADAGQAP